MTSQSEIDELQSAIEDLQSRMAHQDDVLEKLNSVVATHADSIDFLKKQMRLVIEKLQQQKNSGDADSLEHMVDPSQEKPPHY